MWRMTPEEANAEDRRIAATVHKENARVLKAMHDEVDKLYQVLFDMKQQFENGGTVTLHLECGLEGRRDMATVFTTMTVERKGPL